MSTVVAVVGTIAGAGTTTVVTALGTALGEQRRQVALVDATAEGSRIDDALEIDGGGDLADALRRGTAVGDVQASGPHDVAAFPADSETSWGSIRPDAVATLYDQLRDRFEFVLVDCGSSQSPARSAWLGHADEAVIVTDPDVAGTVPETVALTGAFDVSVRGVLANRVPPKEVGDALDALAETDRTVLGVLPEDPTVGIAADAGASVLRTEPDSAIATCAWKLALRVREFDHDEPVVPRGTGQPPGNEGVGAPGGESDGASDASASDVDDRGRDAVADKDDRDGADGASETAASPPEPAPAADAVSMPPPDSDSQVDASGGDADGGGAGDGDAGDGNPAGDSGGQSAQIEAEDPFTQPEPRAVEDDGANGTSAVEDASAVGGTPETSGDVRTDEASASDGAVEVDGATDADEREERGGDSAASQSLDGLLGDVRSHIGDEQRSHAGQMDSAVRDGPGAGDARDADSDEDVTDAESSSSGEPRSCSSEGDESERDGPEGDWRGSDPEPAEPEWAGGASDRDSTASDDGAVLSDDEIESLFEETMDRVTERRESEEGAEDGSEAAEDGPEEDRVD